MEPYDFNDRDDELAALNLMSELQAKEYYNCDSKSQAEQLITEWYDFKDLRV
jgi:hypothetical protein